MASPLDFNKIKLIGFDVDGVLTDGRVIVSDDGQETKNFYSRDGLGLKILMSQGVEVVLITGRISRVVEHRARDLGISELHQKVTNKWAVFQEILQKKNLTPQEAGFAGDDIIDLSIMTRCGLALAPANSSPEVLAVAHYVSPAPGGHGAARQMIEFILKAQNKWSAVIDHFKAGGHF